MAKRSEVRLKCLRHRIAPSFDPCKLCDAKRQADGDFEKTRKIFVGKKKQIAEY